MAELVERIIVAQPIVTDRQRIIASPFQFYMGGDDNLRVEGWNVAAGVTLQVYGRFFSDAGNVEIFEMSIPLNDQRIKVSRDFPVARGYLLNLVVTAVGGSVLVGQTFARVSVIRGFSGATLVMGVMLQGYVTDQQSLAWPGSPIQNSYEIPGFLVTFEAPPLPGPPAFSAGPGVGAHWTLISAGVSIVASAVAGVRRPRLMLQGTGILWNAWSPDTLAAGGAGRFTWAAGLTGNVQTVAGSTTTALPTTIELVNGMSFDIDTVVTDPGDTFNFASYQILERMEIT